MKIDYRQTFRKFNPIEILAHQLSTGAFLGLETEQVLVYRSRHCGSGCIGSKGCIDFTGGPVLVGVSDEVSYKLPE